MLPEIMYAKNVGMIQSPLMPEPPAEIDAGRSGSRANVEERIFTATSRFSLESRARYTSPIPPAPIGD